MSDGAGLVRESHLDSPHLDQTRMGARANMSDSWDLSDSIDAIHATCVAKRHAASII